MPVLPDPIEAVTTLARELGLSTAAGPPGTAVLDLAGIRLRPHAVGWATVELDRAAVELRATGPYEAAAPDRLLGATTRVSTRVSIRDPSDGSRASPVVVLLEPSTEGRISALLARRGEGWAALYLSLDGDPADGSWTGPAVAALGGLGRPTRRGSGPFGDALLVGPAGSPAAGRAAIVQRSPALVVVRSSAGPRTGPDRRGTEPEGVPSAP